MLMHIILDLKVGIQKRNKKNSILSAEVFVIYRRNGKELLKVEIRNM